MPPISRIAQSLRVDEISARYFCNYIQRQFTQPPSHKMIALALEQLGEGNRSREKVIEWLQCNWPGLKLVEGRNQFPSKAPSIRIGLREAGSEDRNPNSRQSRTPARGAGGFIDPDRPEPYSPILSHDPRDYYKGYQKCPHGVVSWGHCAICDPDGYKDYVYEE